MGTHDIIKKGTITILEHPLAMAKLLLPSSEVNEEKKNLVPACPSVHPFDASFSPDHNIDEPTIFQCLYTSVGMEYTINGPQIFFSSSHTDLPSEVMAISEMHMQKKSKISVGTMGRLTSTHRCY